jgi:signal transduction histidine kinase
MAEPTEPKAVITEDGHQTVLRVMDRCFGIYFIGLALLVGHAAYNQKTSVWAFALTLAFPLTNLMLSQISLKLRSATKFEIFRISLNCFFASLSFVVVGGAFDPFWINFVVLTLGQSIILTTVSSNHNYGKVIVLVNVPLMFLTAVLTSHFSARAINWYQFVEFAGLAAMLGLFISLTVDVLVRSLKREHERTKELRESQEHLKEMQETLVSQAHQAGMAETATGILHNVGNILNSINTVLETNQRLSSRDHLERFQKVNDLVEKNKPHWGDFFLKDPKGSQVFDFYENLKKALASDFKTLETESLALHKNIQLVKDVINLQQGFVHGIEFKEEISLTEIVENALFMHTNSFTRHNIQVIKKFSKAPLVLGQKTKLIHVLLNLFKNAKEAMAENAGRPRILTIEIGEDRKAGAFVKISDSGVGVASENLNKIFNHGFTTKKAGHGFGLHSSANSLSEMGGSLSVQSAGLGKGATFILAFNKSCPIESKPSVAS